MKRVSMAGSSGCSIAKELEKLYVDEFQVRLHKVLCVLIRYRIEHCVKCILYS